MAPKIVISEYLKNARLKSGLTQKQLATQLGYTSPQFVSNWERGLSSPPKGKLLNLAVLLNVNQKSLISAYQAQKVKELYESFKG